MDEAEAKNSTAEKLDFIDKGKKNKNKTHFNYPIWNNPVHPIIEQ